MVSDFYAGYNYAGGRRQRCWVHYGRDLHGLKQDNAQNSAVVAWADSILGLYREAKQYQATCRKAVANGTEAFGYGVFDRRRARKNYETALLELARQKMPESPDRQRVLAQRIENFLPELFTFVEYPDSPRRHLRHQLKSSINTLPIFRRNPSPDLCPVEKSPK